MRQFSAQFFRKGKIMSTSRRCYGVLAAVLCLAAGLVLPATAQTEFPACLDDGSPPNGQSQCQCAQKFYRGDYQDPEREYRISMPADVVAALASCGSRGNLYISLTNPVGGETDDNLSWSQIWISGTQRTRQNLRELSQKFAKSEVAIDEAVQTSLSSLPAIRLKMSRTDPDHGKMIYEVIIANNPSQEIVYEIGMVSPAFRYERGHKLFQAIVESFRYVPKAKTDEAASENLH